MGIIDDTIDANETIPIFIFKLKNGPIIISSFEEGMKKHKKDILLHHPMILTIFLSESKQEQFALQPYLPLVLTTSWHFFVKNKYIVSAHPPSVEILEHYTQRVTGILSGEGNVKVPVKKDKASKLDVKKVNANTESNNVIFTDFKNRSNVDPSVITVYAGNGPESNTDPDIA